MRQIHRYEVIGAEEPKMTSPNLGQMCRRRNQPDAEGGLAFNPFGFGVDVREADLDVFRPERHETPAHHVQAGLGSLRVTGDHRERISWRHVPTGASGQSALTGKPAKENRGTLRHRYRALS